MEVHWPTLLLKALILTGVWFLAWPQIGMILMFLMPRAVKHSVTEGAGEPKDPGFAKLGFSPLGTREERIGPWRHLSLVLYHSEGIYCDVPAGGTPYMISRGRSMFLTRAGGLWTIETDGYKSVRVSWPVEALDDLFRRAATRMLDTHIQSISQDPGLERDGTMEHRLDMAAQWYEKWMRLEMWPYMVVAVTYVTAAVFTTVMVMRG